MLTSSVGSIWDRLANLHYEVPGIAAKKMNAPDIKAEMEMKVIGLIGGMSWNSTLEYYRLINEFTAARLGGFHSARIILYSLDFDEIERAQHEARWDDATDILVGAGKALRRAGADFLLICANTMHKVAEPVSERSRLPLLHIGDVVGNAIKGAGFKKVGLLGTKFVMEERFYNDRLQRNFGIEVLVPAEVERSAVNSIIYKELCQEKIESISRQVILQVIKGLVARGAEGIILGCTELPLLIGPDDISIPLFNTMRLHAEAAVQRALA
jgi:aspartate racemase